MATTTAVDINLSAAVPFLNGHYYRATYKGSNAAVNWGDAENASQATTLIGTTGYLATVYSHAENEFIFTQSDGQNLNFDAWLGGSQYGEVSGSSPGNFYWQFDPNTNLNGTLFWNGHKGGTAVTGVYNNWYTSQPDDTNGDEDFVEMWGSKASSQWNDGKVTLAKGYITEWGVSGSAQYEIGFLSKDAQGNYVAPVNAKEGNAADATTWGSLQININKDVLGNYAYDKALIAIPITFSGKAVYNKDYTVGIQADANQGSYITDHALASFSSATTNPFGLQTVQPGIIQPLLVDIDGDSDLDMITGGYDGTIRNYFNVGSVSSPEFAGFFPIPGLPDVGAYSSPSLVDIDGDKDLDAFIGNSGGNTIFFRNTGSVEAPDFSASASSGLPNVGGYASPTFVDIDKDGDFDAFIGNSIGQIYFYKNNGSTSAPLFAAGVLNPFGIVGSADGLLVAPRFFDIDNDQDLDLFIGHGDGNTLFFRNTGTVNLASFAPSYVAFGQSNLGLYNAGVADNLAPTFGDIDGDGDLDAFIGNNAGNFIYQRNDSSSILYVKPAGSTYADTIKSVTLQVKPINDHIWQAPRDVTVTLGQDVGVKFPNYDTYAGDPSTYHIYSLDSTSAYPYGSSSSQQLWIIDDEPTLSLGQGLKQSIYTNLVYSSATGTLANTLNNATSATTLFDADGILESDSYGIVSSLDLLNSRFGMRWEGYIRIPQTASYVFTATSDNGSATLILNANNSSGVSLGTSNVSLIAGQVVWLQMDYYGDSKDVFAQLTWVYTPSGGSAVSEMIPPSALFLSEAAALGSGQGLLEPISGEATGTAFTIYANQGVSSDPSNALNVNLGFSTTDGTTTINSGNAHWSIAPEPATEPGDDYSIWTDIATTSGKLPIPVQPITAPVTYLPLQITDWAPDNTTNSNTPTGNNLSTNLYYLVYNDSYAEANEAITMTLLDGTGYGVASDTMTTTIVDQPLTLSIEGVQNATEGAPNPNDVSDPHLGWVTITSRKNGVLVPNPIQGGLSVNYTITGGTATRGTDYFSPQGTLSTGAAYNAEDIFFFPYGATEAKLYISALADAIREGNETITLQLQTRDIPAAPATTTTPAGPISQYYLVDSSQSSATVTITDSTAWTPGVAFTPPNRTGTATFIRAGVNSSNQQQASVDVHLLSQPNADVKVTLPQPSGTTFSGTTLQTDSNGNPYLTFTSTNWSTAQSISITGLSSSVNTTLTATTSSTDDSFYAAGLTASQTIVPSGSTADLPLTLWEGGPAEPFTSTVTVSTIDGNEGSTDEFGFTLNLDAPRVDSDLEVFFSLVAGSGFQLSGNTADATSSTAQRSYNPLLLKGGSAYANLGSFATVGTGGVFSAEAWVRADGTSAATTAVLDFSDGSNLNDIMLGFAGGSLTPLLTLTDSAGQSIGSISGGTALVPGQWNHLAFSLDNNLNASLYLNGDVVASSKLSATPLSESRSHNLAGGLWASPGFLNGAVRDVRVWNTSRSEEQIQASMVSSNASGSNLIGAWGFNNSTANAVSGGSTAALLNTASFEATTTYGIVIPVGASSAAVQFTAVDDTSVEGTLASLVAGPGGVPLPESISLSLKGSGSYTFTPNSLSSAYLDDNDTVGVVFSLLTDTDQVSSWTVASSATTNEGDATNTPPSFTTLGLTLASEPSLDPGQGLYQTLYPQFNGASALPDSSTPAPVLIDSNGINETDDVPDGTFSTIGLVDNFGIRWEGYIRIPQTGAYQFQTICDDGVRLSLKQNNANGTSLAPISSSSPYSIDSWTGHPGATIPTSSVNLNAGDVVWVQMDYWEQAGRATAQLQWIRTPSGGSPVTEMIPASALFLTEAGAAGTTSSSDVTVTLNSKDINSAELQVSWQPANFSASSAGAFGLPLSQGGYASPTFVDIDADGDQDAFIGNNGSILFYRNTGSASSAAFSTFSQGAFGLPATATGALGYVQASSFVDIDGDGDQDAFIGSNTGETLFFQNTGTKSVAAFAGSSNPFGLTAITGASITGFADIDHDGDFDAFIGNQEGNVLFFRNTGTNLSPQFASASTNPFGITTVNGDAAPAFVDFDRDGDLDLFIGKEPNDMSDLVYFRNTGNVSSPAFASAVTNAFGLPHTGLRLARPAFVDIDADGNADAFIGYNTGSTLFFQGNPSVSVINGNYTLTFNANNWNHQQQLLLQGVDDLVNDGDKPMPLTFNVTGTDPDYNGLASVFTVTNVDNDANKNPLNQGANATGNGSLVSIAAPAPGSLAEGSTSTSSFVVTLLDQPSLTDTVVYYDLDRKSGNALDYDVQIQPNAGSSTMAGLTLLSQLAGGDLFSQIDSDGINETPTTFASKGLTGSFTSTWSGWVQIDQSGDYTFLTSMTGGSIKLYVKDLSPANALLSGETENNNGTLTLTGGTFVPISLEFSTTTSTTDGPAVSVSWTRPSSNGGTVTEILPANRLQRVDGRHVVIPAGSTSGGFNVSVVDDYVDEGVGGSNQENLVLVMLDAQPMQIEVMDWTPTSQGAQLTLDISGATTGNTTSSNREESYQLAAGTRLQLLADPTDPSSLRAYYTLTEAVTLHRDETTPLSTNQASTVRGTSTQGTLTDPSGATYSGTMANLVGLVSSSDATGTYNAIDASVSVQAINNWQPTNFSASSAGAFGLPLSQGGYASPTFVDIDADGDQDAFIGKNDSILFYRNTGSASSAAFSTFSQGAFGLPAPGYGALGYVQASSFVDIDGDGDQDAFIGSNSGSILFFQNTGTKSVAAFAGSSNPFGLTVISGASVTSFVDIDHDGDFDAFIGNDLGNTLFFRNTGNYTSPQFASASTNPFGINKVSGDAAPAFVDIDRDGDLDLFIGQDPSGTSSDLIYFRNTGNASSPAFASAVTNAFGLPQTDLRLPRPAFVDIDADGNSDAFIGYNTGSTLFFQGNSSVDLALAATNRSSVTLPVGTVLSYSTPADSGGTQNLNLTLKNALTLQAPSGGAVTGTVQTASVGVSNQSGSSTVAAIQGLSSLVQVSPALQLTLLDNDTPGVFISSDSAGTTAVSSAVIALSESGASTDRWIRLTSQPTETVTVYLQTSDSTEVLLQPAAGGLGVNRLSLNFTEDNWNIAQKFTLQPQNDFLIDGSISLYIATSTLSSDPLYANITGPALNVSVGDNDVAGLSRSLVSSTLSQGSNGFFNLSLNAQPTADVNVTLTPDSQFTVNERGVGMAETITFTPDNWSVQHKVELKAVDDTAVEDITHSQLSITTSSSDANFQGLSVTPVSVDIVDNDLPMASIQLVNNSTEEAAPGSFSIKLSAPAPSSVGSDGVLVNYTITSLTLDPGLGYSDSPSDTLDKIVQTPLVSGQIRILPGSDTSDAFVVPIDDYYPDLNDKQFVVSLINPSIGSGYQINPTDPNSTATISIINNDKAGIAIITTGSRAGTQEGSTPDTGGMFQVVLLAQPAANAVVNVILTESSADTSRQLGTSSVPYTQTITFTSDNWYIPQTVTVYAYDDDRIAVQNGTGPGFELEDPSRPYTGYQTAQLAYRFESTDSNYNTDSHIGDDTYFTNTISQTVDVMDRTLSANTDILVNNSLITLQDGIEDLALPLVGGLEGKVGSVFRGFLNTLVDNINISGTPAANELKKIIEDNIPASNGFSPLVTLSMDASNNTRVQFQFQGQENLYSVPLANDLGTPALGFQANGSLDVAFDYTAQATLVFTPDNVISLDTTPANTYVTARYNGGFPDNFSISGGLGMHQLTGVNKQSTNSNIGDHSTELDVTFTLDANQSSGSGGDGSLSYDELTTPDISQQDLFDYNFDLPVSKATLSLGATVNDTLNASLPQIDFDLATSFPLFDYADSVAATTPGNSSTLYIDNLKLDLGSYISNSIQKYVAIMDPVLAPILPIINAWNSDIPIFKSLGIADTFDVNKDGKVTLLEAMETEAGYIDDLNPTAGMELYAGPPIGELVDILYAFFNVLDDLIQFSADVADYKSSGDNFTIDLGSYASSSIFFASDLPAYSLQNTPVDSGDTSQFSSTTAEQANAGGQDSNGISSDQLSAFVDDMRGLGFSLDIIDGPENVIKLMFNQVADIFSWTPPAPTIDFGISKDFPIADGGVVEVEGLLEGLISMTANLDFGFDTLGLSRWRDSGFKASEASKALEGFYMVDQHDGNQDLPEFSFSTDVAAGIGLVVGGVVRFDILGGILGESFFNLVDQPDSSGTPDYKIRFSDSPALDISGDIEVYLEAKVQVGESGIGDFPPIWITVWEDELAHIELFSFDKQVSGTVSNGYIEGSKIFFDHDYNGINDASEPSDVSTGDARFNLSIDPRTHDTNKDGVINDNEGHLVASGGTDTSINLPVKVPFLGLASGIMITPVTTILALGLEQGDDAAVVNQWINEAFQLRGFDFLNSDSVQTLKGQDTGVIGGIDAQSAYVAHAKLHFAFDQLLTTLQSIEPLLLQSDTSKQLVLMGHVAKALFSHPSSEPINVALAEALAEGTESWIASASPQLDERNAAIARDVARHASVTIQEFGRLLDQVATSYRDSDGATFLAAINDVKADGFGYFRSSMPGLTAGIQSFATPEAFLLALNARLVATEAEYASAESVDLSGNGVSSVTANGTYTAGSVITVLVPFTQTVTVSGSPSLLLQTGSTMRQAVYSQGSGSSILAFTYTVEAGDNSADLDYASTLALELNGGTIKDRFGDSVNLSLPTPGGPGSLGANADLVIDALAPSLSSTNPVDGATGVAESANIQLTFSEPVRGGTGTLRLLRADGTTVESFDVSTGFGSAGGSASFNGSTVILDPYASLLSKTAYSLTIPATAITDAVGNPFAGISDPSTFNFTTGNQEAPFQDAFVTGSGAGGQSQVKLIDASGNVIKQFLAFENFNGSVSVANDDLNGDGIKDIVASAGAGGGPHVKVFDGVSANVIASFYAYESSFSGGVYVAVGDLNGDGKLELITGAGSGGGPHVKVFALNFNGAQATPQEIASFFAYDASFRGGVSVAAGDVDGDGAFDIITGAGAGGGPHVKAFGFGAPAPDLGSIRELASFYAYASNFSGGVSVASGNIDGVGADEIITGAGAGGGPHVKAFSRTPDGTPITVSSFYAYDPNFLGGVDVGTTMAPSPSDVSRVLTGAGPGGGPHVRGFDLSNSLGQPLEVLSFYAASPNFTGGVSVS